MSTTTTTTTRDRGDRYGPIEWAQQSFMRNYKPKQSYRHEHPRRATHFITYDFHLDLLTSVSTHAEVLPYSMRTEFGVDSSNSFSFKARTHTVISATQIYPALESTTASGVGNERGR